MSDLDLGVTVDDREGVMGTEAKPRRRGAQVSDRYTRKRDQCVQRPRACGNVVYSQKGRVWDAEVWGALWVWGSSEDEAGEASPHAAEHFLCPHPLPTYPSL